MKAEPAETFRVRAPSDEAPAEAGGGERAAVPLVASGDGDVAHVTAPAAPPPPGEVIEPARALALADFAPPSLGAGERLLRFAYRMGIPGGALQAPFRKTPKLRLLATVANPLPGDRAAGMALRAGHFLIHGAKIAIADMDFTGTRLAPPILRTVHGFRWLDDLAACAPREACAPVAERILAAWFEANPKLTKGPAWSVGLAAERLLAWLIHAPLLLSGSDKPFRAKVLEAAVETARWLDRHVAKAEDRLAEVAGWCAITAAGLLLPEGKPRRLYGEAGLMRTLGELIGDDGGVLSRSPLAQVEAISLLVRLGACYRACRREPPEAVGRVQALLVPPLLGVLHGDGGLSSWQGAAALDAARIEALVEASGARVRPLKDARQWGYQRVTAGRSVLLLDAAPPPSARHARDGCASTLAFELSHGRQRLIVNCGGAALAGGLIPLRLANGLRATAAHSTLVLDDNNSTAVLRDGRLGAGVSEVEVDRRAVALDSGGGATRLEAAHDGYAARYGLTHRRILMLRDGGEELRGQDLLLPVGKRARRAKAKLALRFHLGPGVEAYLWDHGQGVALALPDGSHWQFRCSDGEIAIDDSLWADGQGRPLGTTQLVVHATVSRGGGSFSWLLKKMG